MEEPKSHHVSIGFETAKDKPTYAVGGAWGGPSPDGSAVVAHVYVEYFALPNYLTYGGEEVDEGVRVDTTTEKRVSRNDVTREVQASLVMTPEVAMSLANFLAGKAQQADEIRRRRAGDSNREEN